MDGVSVYTSQQCGHRTRHNRLVNGVPVNVIILLYCIIIYRCVWARCDSLFIYVFDLVGGEEQQQQQRVRTLNRFRLLTLDDTYQCSIGAAGTMAARRYIE